MTRRSTVLLLLSNLLLSAALALELFGIFGASFWVKVYTYGKVENGLVRTCQEFVGKNRQCSLRDSIFKFEQHAKDVNADHRDIVLLTFTVSAATAFLSLLILLCVVCVEKKALWRCTTSTIVILTATSAISSLGGLIYSELKLSSVWKEMGRLDAYAYMCTWIGCALMWVTALFTCVLMCCSYPRNRSSFDLTDNTKRKKGKHNSAFEIDTKTQTPVIKVKRNGKMETIS